MRPGVGHVDLVEPRAALKPAWQGLSPPPLARNRRTASPSGAVLTNPSPMRAARSIAFGPNPET